MQQRSCPSDDVAMSAVVTELARRSLDRRSHEQFLKDNQLEKDQILVRLNEAANMAEDPEKAARILMQISKFLGYV